MYDDGNFEVHFFFFQGDRARYPFKLRGKPLVTIPIVVAVLKTGKTHSTSMNAFSPFINPVNTALRDGGRIQIIKGINSGNFSRLHIYNTVCHKRPKAACGGCLAPKTSRLQGDDAFFDILKDSHRERNTPPAAVIFPLNCRPFINAAGRARGGTRYTLTAFFSKKRRAKN